MTQIAPAGGLAVLAAVMAYGSYHFHRQAQTYTDTETTTTAALEEGQVKLRGRIEPLETVMSPVTGEDVVAVDYTFRADPEHDDEPVETVVRGRRAADFELVDDQGRVRVEPMEATYLVSDGNTVKTRSETVDTDVVQAFEDEIEDDFDGSDREGVHARASGALNTSLGGADFQAEYRDQRFRHEVLKPDDEVQVLGIARRENGESVVCDGDGKFVISDKDEEAVTSQLSTRKWLLLVVAVALAAGSLYFLVLG